MMPRKVSRSTMMLDCFRNTHSSSVYTKWSTDSSHFSRSCVLSRDFTMGRNSRSTSRSERERSGLIAIWYMIYG